MNFEIVLQIFSGGFSGGKPVSYEAVEKKLSSVLPRLPVSKVIMGWATNKLPYEKTAEFLAKKNIDFYLWLPVFSESGKLKTQTPIMDFRGRQPENVSGHGDEDFSFCCPNNPGNVENVLAIFEEEFSAIPFTGVFLDKIRYPSFAQGGQGNVFSCFCPHCQVKYGRENFSPLEFINALDNPFPGPLGIRSYSGNGKYEFEDPVIARFFSLKAAFITHSLRRICGYFREKGYCVGLDVFAPFLSSFVGQDLTALSALSDFIKPMMYRLTNAPAGLPFEMEALQRETVGKETLKRQRFFDLLGFNPGEKVFDLTFTVKELQNMAASTACPVYAGLEINRKENLAEVYPDYVEETVKAYAGAGIRGLVLSWDLLEAPEENITRVVDVVNRL